MMIKRTVNIKTNQSIALIILSLSCFREKKSPKFSRVAIIDASESYESGTLKLFLNKFRCVICKHRRVSIQLLRDFCFREVRSPKRRKIFVFLEIFCNSVRELLGSPEVGIKFFF